jgi:transcription-repair coupling factor (superfamily II helicase)
VQERGQAARRGGLIDAWPPSEPCPLRIEFDGTELTSIRRFDPADQRSVPESHKIHDILLPPAILSIGNRKSLAACARAPARELGQAEIENHKSYASLVTHLPADTIFFWVEKCGPEIEKAARKYAGIACHADLLEKSAADAGAAKQIVSFRELTSEIAGGNHRQCFSVLEYSPRLALKLRNERSLPPSRRGKAPLRRDDGPRSPGFSHSAAGSPAIDLGFEALASMYERMDVTAYRRDADTSIPPNADTIQENRQRWLTMLETKARRGMKIHLFFDTPGALERFRNAFEKYPFKLHPGVLTDGFLHDDLGLGVIAESFIFRPNVIRRQPALKQQPAAIGRAAPPEKVAGITDLTDIEPGDLVVHANHGIGKYLGLYEMVFNGKLQETLTIEYAGRTRLYVPAAQANLVSRYFTAGGRKSKIHRIGGSQWSREKLSAEKAIYSLASSLLETQALRETISGFAFPRDVPWQHDFEASFFYEETDDQEKAIADVKADMESNVPMDRLICGDAGYGKTEVAMRAAFKAVMAGKQVAVLVPTTVLALQHYEVFQQRMASYPLRVELLCRFRSGAEQHRVAGELKKGLVDIVIGTHRLLQPDIAFKDIGLIIIDEEQRFGVEHKEYLKHLKKLADVLTLTATPIPRTLYMSLTGARRISMIQTPPKDRLPIETIVAKNDERLVREAILHEVNRGGQVFYLHNRVASMETARTRLQKIVPEARIAIAHGQMSSRDLATTMHEFGKGAFDVLLCTTIVESGVDLPNVNTILIDRADRFGIADLYQLRGRVGRSGRKAYAYLFTPVHGYLLDISRRRLGAVLEHNKLGSGFKLAMMDLEIRGAGNLLGPEQSGYISAIGFDLYCQLLRRTIEYIKSGGKPSVSHGPPSAALGPPREVESMLATPVAVEVDLDFISLAAKSPDPASAAFMPAAYIEDEETRIKVYRKIASAVSLKELESLRGEFKDRFGPLPEPFERLLKIAAIRVMASAKNITTVESKQGKLMLRRKGEYLQVKNQFPRLRAADADGKLGEIIAWLGRM